MTANDYSLGIDHDRLAPPKLTNGSRHLVDSLLRNLARVPTIRNDFFKWPQSYLHGSPPGCRELGSSHLPCNRSRPGCVRSIILLICFTRLALESTGSPWS